MEDPIVTRHLGRITYQGPESEAPDWPLPIDLPACEDQEAPSPSPLDTLTAADLIFFALGVVGTSVGGTIAIWMLK